MHDALRNTEGSLPDGKKASISIVTVRGFHSKARNAALGTILGHGMDKAAFAALSGHTTLSVKTLVCGAG
jgi:hypothetical protein